MIRDRERRRDLDKPLKKKFSYKRQDPSKIKKRSQQSGGMYDQLFRPDIPVFTPKVGTSYRVRIMPPTWEDADHYGYDLYIHSQVGADNQRYVCLAKHKDEECPACEDEKELKRAGEDQAAYDAKAKRSVIVYCIDRDDEQAGPQLWRMKWMDDRIPGEALRR